MSGVAEQSAAMYDSPEPADTGVMTIALIGPNEAHRKIMARALASGEARTIREFTNYPPNVTDLPKILEEHFDVVMVDVDSDESYGIKIIEAIAGLGGTVVMAYSRRNDSNLLMSCMRAGARDFLPLPSEAEAVEEAAPEEPAATDESEIYRFSDQRDADLLDDLDEDDEFPITYDYAAESTQLPEPVMHVPEFTQPVEKNDSPEPSKAPNSFEDWDNAHLRFMKAAGPQAVPRSVVPSEPLPGSVEEWDQAHLRAAESIASRGPIVPAPTSKTVQELFAKAEKKSAPVPLRMVPPPPPPPQAAPENIDRPPIPPEMLARGSKRMAEATLRAATVPVPEKLIEPVPTPVIPHDQFLKPESQRGVDAGATDLFMSQPDRRRVPVPPPDIPLFQYSAPEEEKKRNSIIPMVIGAMVLGVAACVGIVYYAHPFGLGLASVATAPLGGTPQAATTANDANTAVAEVTPQPAKPAAALRATAADGSDATPVANRVSSDMMDAQLAAQSKLSQDIKKPVANDDPEPPSGFSPVNIDTGASAPGAVFNGKNDLKVVPAASAISAGVASGLLIHKTAPVYPKFARDAHIGGTVTLGATIATTGDLTNLHVIGGPPALRDAALEAARKWRYRPYMLDNKPIEVQTTINVVFSIGQ